jgi:hypothetical protein
MAVATYAGVSWERMSNAVGKMSGGGCSARRRLWKSRASPYAVAGGNAVAAWVSRVDEAAVRNTPDVDIVLRRTDLPAARTALEQAGFVYRHVASIDRFLDGPEAKARDAVHIVFAAEKVRADYAAPVPDVSESEATETFRLLSLDALVRMKLTSFRDKDRVHLRDLIDMDLVDAGWLEKVPATLRSRLQELLDNPEG